jgi:hypothetical protein
MIEIAEFMQTPNALWLLALAVLIFGVAPGLALRLLVLIYPKTDPRRRELRGEMKAVPYLERWLFVGEQLETVLVEGVPHRVAAIRQARARRSRRKPTWMKVWGHRAVVRPLFGGLFLMAAGAAFWSQPAAMVRILAEQNLPLVNPIVAVIAGIAASILGMGFMNLSGHEAIAIRRRLESRTPSR